MRYFSFVVVATSLTLLPARARADLPPPDTLSCHTASVGDPCDPDGQATDGGTKAGTCQKATCTRLDYANWNRDASAAPPTMDYECLKCVIARDAGTDAASATGGAGGAATGGSGGAAATGGAAGGAPKSDSGCAVSGPGTAFGPWLLAGGFATAVWFARRRR
jgi:hypothetical protein